MISAVAPLTVNARHRWLAENRPSRICNNGAYGRGYAFQLRKNFYRHFICAAQRQ